MKQKLLSVLLVLAMALTLLPTAAFAVEGQEPELEMGQEMAAEPEPELAELTADEKHVTAGETTYATIKEALDANQTAITVTKNLTEDVSIPANKTVTLTINQNVTLTNKSGHTITVAQGGTLTLKGPGKVDSVIDKKGALYNSGTATLQDGVVLDRSAETSTGSGSTSRGNNSWYTIYNNGVMTISNATVTTANKATDKGKYSSLICNLGVSTNTANGTNQPGTLTISGGEFSGGLNTVKNDDYSILTISGGTFSNTAQHVILNWSKADISGGTFTVSSVNSAAVFGAGWTSGSSTTSVPDSGLTITGGTFTGTNHPVVEQGSKTDKYQPALIKIEGGTFTSSNAPVVKKGTGEPAADFTITGGRFSTDPFSTEKGNATGVTSETYEAKLDSTDSKYVVEVKTAPAKATLAFANPEGTTPFYGKTASEMGSFTIDASTTDQTPGVTTIKVTGSANYVSDYTGWGVSSEQKGHYLPLKITATPNTLEKITTYNRTEGAKDGKEIALTNGAEDVAFFLDGKQNCEGLAENTFKVVASAKAGATGANVYVIDFSGVVLLPNSTTTSDKTTVTVDKDEAESLGNLIKGDSTSTDTNAPVKVEGTDGDKTLTFTGKDGTSASPKQDTAVTLPKELIDVVTSTATGAEATKADVKVESSAGSVTVPSDTLKGVTDTVTIKVEKATTVDTTDATIEVKDEALTTTEESAIKTAIGSATNAVTITATKGDSDTPLVGTDNDNELTITIAVGTDGTYIVLCVSGGKITSFGEQTSASGVITVKSKHLSDWVAISEASASSDLKSALDKVKTEESTTPPAPETSITFAYTEKDSLSTDDQKLYFGGKLVISGLETNTKYLVTYDQGVAQSGKEPRIAQVVSIENEGDTVSLGCMRSMKIMVLKITKDNVNDPAGWTTLIGAGNKGLAISELPQTTPVTP